jgi:hypothetical protein
MALKQKEGKHYRFELTDDRFSIIVHDGDLEFWAMNGLIAILDTGTGEFNVITRREWLNRAQAVNQMNRKELDPGQRAKIDRAVSDMIACCKDAQKQGDPLDPKVQAWHRRHKPKNVHMLLPAIPGTKQYEQDQKAKKKKKIILPSGVL